MMLFAVRFDGVSGEIGIHGFSFFRSRLGVQVLPRSVLVLILDAVIQDCAERSCEFVWQPIDGLQFQFKTAAAARYNSRQSGLLDEILYSKSQVADCKSERRTR